MSDTEPPSPECIDGENPEWTAEDMKRARPAAVALPESIGWQVIDELTRRREWREWLWGLEPLRARTRELMRAQGYDPERMTDEENMDYVDRVIHEHREEELQRSKANIELVAMPAGRNQPGNPKRRSRAARHADDSESHC